MGLPQNSAALRLLKIHKLRQRRSSPNAKGSCCSKLVKGGTSVDLGIDFFGIYTHSFTQALKGNKKRQIKNLIDQPDLVAPVGIEPTSSESESEILSIEIRSQIPFKIFLPIQILQQGTANIAKSGMFKRPTRLFHINPAILTFSSGQVTPF